MPNKLIKKLANPKVKIEIGKVISCKTGIIDHCKAVKIIKKNAAEKKLFTLKLPKKKSKIRSIKTLTLKKVMARNIYAKNYFCFKFCQMLFVSSSVR